jgi:hypothetical protein
MRAIRLFAVTTAIASLVLVTGFVAQAQDEPPSENMCIQCHGTEDIWDAKTRHLFVTAESLAADIHWQKGIRCQDCHGGNATTTDLRSAHAVEDGFRKITTPADVPDFCGHCHSDGEYMKKFRPDAPLDIVDKFWASTHGQDLKKQAQELSKVAAPPAAVPDSAAPPPAVPDTAAPPAEVSKGAAPPADAPSIAPVQTEVPDTTAPPADASTATVPPAAAPAAAQPAIEVPHSARLPAASCMACHPQHQMLPSSDPRSALNSRHLAETCGVCHLDELVSLRRSVHAKAGDKNDTGAGTLLDCNKCHGHDAHGMLPVKDPASSVFLDHQVQICGECHKDYLATYEQSVHGSGLIKSGLLVTAVCSDCHGAHDILYAADQRSTLHPSNVATRCGKCHYFLAQRLAQSVHGDKAGAGNLADRLAPGGKQSRKPSCTDCHQGHDQVPPDSPEFRAELPNRCGNCHAGLADRYRLSLHGELTEFGYLSVPTVMARTTFDL